MANTTHPDDADITLDSLNFSLMGVALLIVCLIGLVCNSLVITVLLRKAMRSSTNVFLLSLAIFDATILLCTIFMLCLVPLSKHYDVKIYAHVTPYIYPVALTAQTYTIWITVCFTVERYIAVCHPLKASIMCTIKRARFTIIGVFILAIVYNITRWFEFHPKATGRYEEINGENYSVYELAYTNFGNNSMYDTIYYTAMYPPIMNILPVILLAVFNTFLVLAVRKSMKERQRMGIVAQTKEHNITIMLISVVLVFILCQTPAAIYAIAWRYIRKQTEGSRGWAILSFVRNFLVNVNSAVNFILYCVLGQKFRKEFRVVFLCKKSLTRKEPSTAYTSNGSYVKAPIPLMDKNSNRKSYTELPTSEKKDESVL